VVLLISSSVGFYGEIMSIPDIVKESYDLFDRHSGVWEGEYVILDVEGKRIDSYRSCLRLARKGNQWLQRNHYMFGDDREDVVFQFEGKFNDKGELLFDTPRLRGKAWASQGVVLLHWEYVQPVANFNSEQINMIGEGRRMRSWQLSEQGSPKGHVIIQESQSNKDSGLF